MKAAEDSFDKWVYHHAFLPCKNNKLVLEIPISTCFVCSLLKAKDEKIYLDQVSTYARYCVNGR